MRSDNPSLARAHVVLRASGARDRSAVAIPMARLWTVGQELRNSSQMSAIVSTAISRRQTKVHNLANHELGDVMGSSMTKTSLLTCVALFALCEPGFGQLKPVDVVNPGLIQLLNIEVQFKELERARHCEPDSTCPSAEEIAVARRAMHAAIAQLADHLNHFKPSAQLKDRSGVRWFALFIGGLGAGTSGALHLVNNPRAQHDGTVVGLAAGSLSAAITLTSLALDTRDKRRNKTANEYTDVWRALTLTGGTPWTYREHPEDFQHDMLELGMQLGKIQGLMQ